MEFWRNSTKEFNPSYQSNRKNKKTMRLDFSRRFKTKSSNSVPNCKEFPKKKLKDMLTCKALENLTKSSLQILNLTVFQKIDKLSQARFHQLSKCLVKKKVEKRLKLTVNFVTKIKKPIKSLMIKNNMKGIERTSKTLIRKYKSCLLKSIISLLQKTMMIDYHHFDFMLPEFEIIFKLRSIAFCLNN